MDIALPSQLPRPPGSIIFWVIYEKPRDQPDGYVLRPQFVSREGTTISEIAWRSKDPEELRNILPAGVTFFGRMDGDDPCILEVWME